MTHTSSYFKTDLCECLLFIHVSIHQSYSSRISIAKSFIYSGTCYCSSYSFFYKWLCTLDSESLMNVGIVLNIFMFKNVYILPVMNNSVSEYQTNIILSISIPFFFTFLPPIIFVGLHNLFCVLVLISVTSVFKDFLASYTQCTSW